MEAEEKTSPVLLQMTCWCCFHLLPGSAGSSRKTDSLTPYAEIYVWFSGVNLMMHISKDVRNPILLKIMSL